MVSEMGRLVLEKINEQKGRVLSDKMDEIDELLKPYTTFINNGNDEIVWIPDDRPDISEQYEKLNKEFREIVDEIKFIDRN